MMESMDCVKKKSGISHITILSLSPSLAKSLKRMDGKTLNFGANIKRVIILSKLVYQICEEELTGLRLSTSNASMYTNISIYSAFVDLMNLQIISKFRSK